jgi:quinoprotein glucose dehydrogenase
VFTGYRYFLDPEGYQANAYPWGTLNAVDMNTGKYLWTVPYGEHTELAEKGLTNTGAGSHGGTVMTATGVLFTGGSEYDTKFRAYDSATGKVLWTGQLPGPGVSTPATYAVNGKQYVVIAASPAGRGGGQGAPAATSGIKSGTYVVFALP